MKKLLALVIFVASSVLALAQAGPDQQGLGGQTRAEELLGGTQSDQGQTQGVGGVTDTGALGGTTQTTQTGGTEFPIISGPPAGTSVQVGSSIEFNQPQIFTQPPIGETREDVEKATRIVLSGDLQKDIDALQRSVGNLRNQILMRPTSAEFRKILNEALDKQTKQLEALLAQQFAAQNALIGKKAASSSTSVAKATSTSSTAGATSNGAEEDKSMFWQYLFWTVLVIAAAITIGWWWGHGVLHRGLKDDNRESSKAFDPQGTPQGWGRFSTLTTKTSSKLEAVSETVAVAEANARAEAAASQAVIANNRHTERMAMMLSARPALAPAGGAALPYQTPPGFTHGSSEPSPRDDGKLRLTIHEHGQLEDHFRKRFEQQAKQNPDKGQQPKKQQKAS